jgi:hypothetical protein
MSTSAVLPRAYWLGLETFFRHHPNHTLFLLAPAALAGTGVVERFRAHGFQLTHIQLDIERLISLAVERLPELRALVFDTPQWRHEIRPHVMRHAMVLADFARLVLLYAHGGSWIDADALYLRPLTAGLHNALPCHERIDRDAPNWLQCDPLTQQLLPFVRSRAVVRGASLYCTNGVMAAWDREHPFLAEALRRIVRAWPAAQAKAYTMMALGGHLLVDTLVADGRVMRDAEWPQLVPLAQLYGAWVGDDLSAQYGAHTAAKVRDLTARGAYSMQLYGFTALAPDAMRDAFRPGTLWRALWQRHCVFTCAETIP